MVACACVGQSHVVVGYARACAAQACCKMQRVCTWCADAAATTPHQPEPQLRKVRAFQRACCRPGGVCFAGRTVGHSPTIGVHATADATCVARTPQRLQHPCLLIDQCMLLSMLSQALLACMHMHACVHAYCLGRSAFCVARSAAHTRLGRATPAAQRCHTLGGHGAQSFWTATADTQPTVHASACATAMA